MTLEFMILIRRSAMLVVGGYLITYDQLTHIGTRRGLDLGEQKSHLLNADLRRKGISSIWVLPVDYPRRSLTTPGVPGILIATCKRDEHLTNLEDSKPFVEDEEDRKAKLSLKINEIHSAPFLAVSEPSLHLAFEIKAKMKLPTRLCRMTYSTYVRPHNSHQ